MLRKFSLLVILLFSFTAYAGQKEGKVQYNASTGDTRLDLSLGKLNLKADGNINDFIAALGYEYKVPVSKIENLIVGYNFSAADAYMTVSIGSMTGRSLDEVADVYRNNQGKGWGFVAKQLGIKPGSKEFHQLKNGSERIFESEQDTHQSKAKKNKNEHKGKPDNRGNNRHDD